MNSGELWLINLDPTVGAEIQKTRPALIINDDDLGTLPLRIIVPITDWKERYSAAAWMVEINPDRLNGLSKASSIDAFQIRSISIDRFIRKLGVVDLDTIVKVEDALLKVLKIEF